MTNGYATVVGIREDMKWLHTAWQHIRDRDAYIQPDPASVHGERLDKFLTRMHLTAASDTALRGLYGFTGCVWGEGKRCPRNSPVFCGGCIENVY